MISKVHTCKIIETKTSTNKKLKPKLSIDYNKKIYGVDLVYQNISNYRISRSRGKNIISNCFFHLLDLCLWNEYKCYCKGNGKKITNLKFRFSFIFEYFER